MKHDRNEVPKNETFAEHFAKDLQEVLDYKCLPPPSPTTRRLDDDSSSSGSNNNDATESSLCKHGSWEINNSVHRGFYAHQLERFHRQGYRLGHNLLVFQYERFKNDPSMVFDEIMDFLEVPRHAYQAHQLNRTIVPVKSRHDTESLTLSQETRNVVHEFYKPYNDQLADLLGEEWRGIWDH
jgi:Sulfotransferase domain